MTWLRRRHVKQRQLLSLEVWAEVLHQSDMEVAIDYKHGEATLTLTNHGSEIAWPLNP